MPIYEFECQNCGHQLQLVIQWGDNYWPTCPKCHNVMKKVLSAPSLLVIK